MYYNKYLNSKKKYLQFQFGAAEEKKDEDSAEDCGEDFGEESVEESINNFEKNYIFEQELEEELNNFYLPCEITHKTDFIYKNYKNYNFFDNFLTKNLNKDGSQYKQDVFIQLLYQFENKYLNITPQSSNTDCFDFDKYYIKYTICTSNTCTFTHKRDERITRTFNKCENISNQCLNENNYNLNSSDSIKEKITIDPSFNELYNNNKFKFINILDHEFNQTKGGNFISGPKEIIIGGKCGYPIFCISGSNLECKHILEQTKSHIIELECGFKGDNNTFRHIDELMCFMPYGKKENGDINYKIWFYAELTENNFSSMEFRAKVSEFNEERMTNLNIICHLLFNDEFENCQEYFVFFDFYTFLPSIMNRSLIETGDDYICIMNNINSQTANFIKFTQEKELIQSCISDKKPRFFTIPVPQTREDNPEGGPHCLFKQCFLA